ncbi:hypothetical protein PoB_000091700 [Plakobranchus ocellatus]|uniref:Uncharacterized protein n=1 Tax=Plakobranchus ocellatus TaxID=259542 RepID=A0AAV3XW98_9GAST|nr:hypothetical protein PoB_000091700 [Plakobranchus ocellatus]
MLKQEEKTSATKDAAPEIFWDHLFRDNSGDKAANLSGASATRKLIVRPAAYPNSRWQMVMKKDAILKRVARANLTKEGKDFLNSAQTDVDDEKNTEEETENDGYQRTAPSTSSTSLSVAEIATHMTPIMQP